MKYFNVISTLTCNQQYEIRRWFLLTMLSLLLLFVSICFFIIPQLVDLYRQRQRVVVLRNMVQHYNEVKVHQMSLQKESDLITTRQKKIKRYMSNQKNPLDYFLSVSKLCQNGVQLERIAKNKKECDIIFLSPTIEKAIELVSDLLKFQSFSDVKLSSIEHDAQQNYFRCAVKAFII